MTEEIFAIFDSAAGAFLTPWTAQTIEVALRRFRAALAQEESDFSRFPEDYTLFHVGTFDKESGLISAVAPPHSLGVAVTFMERRTQAEHSVKVES